MGDHTESEEDIKIDIKEASIDLIYIKEEPKEEIIDLDENCHAGTSGESSVKKELEVYGDDLLDPLDTDIIMENEFVKLEDIKGESRSFETFHCNKCNKIYKGYCIKCSTLSRILNKIPTDILEIRDTSMGKGVFLLKPLPKNIIFGPFEGVPPIESTKGYSWKIKDKKLVNIDNGSWIKDITSAVNALIRNLDIFQFDGKLYLETIREVVEGDELLIYYNDEEIQASDNSEECYFIPQKRDELPKAFACTLCCYGFSSDECLVEHKSKCPHAEQNADVEDFELTECACCKIWLEKQEYQDYHMAYCWRKNQRMWYDYSEAVERCEAIVEEVEEHLTTKDDEREHQCDMPSKTYNERDDLQLHLQNAVEILKTHQYFSATPIESEYTEKAMEEKYERSKSSDQTSDKINLEKPHQCDVCMTRFTQRSHLKLHKKNIHGENKMVKDYKCSECSFQTNYRSSWRKHVKLHKKLFQCNVCMVKFTSKALVKSHVKSKHPENKIGTYHNCPECSYQTNIKSNWRKHVDTHKGIKPFQCDTCKVKFTESGSLKKHIKNMHPKPGAGKEYKCTECSYQTNYKHALILHRNKHNKVKIKPFECQICTGKFTRKNSLKTHMNSKHATVGV